MKNKLSNYTLPENSWIDNACIILLKTLLFLFLCFIGYLALKYYNLAYPSDAFCKTNYDSGIDIKEAKGCEDYYLSRGY